MGGVEVVESYGGLWGAWEGCGGLPPSQLACHSTSPPHTQAFAPYGDIESAVVKPGSSAHGYVNFVAPESARAAAEAESVELLGHWCWVTLGKKKHQPVEEGGPTDGLGLFNLPFATTYEELHALLAGHPGFQVCRPCPSTNIFPLCPRYGALLRLMR